VSLGAGGDGLHGAMERERRRKVVVLVVGVAGVEHWPPGGPRGRGQQLVHKGDVGDGEAQGLDAG